MDVPDCDKILNFVKFSISWAMSASRMRLSDAVRFTAAADIFEAVCSRRF